MKRRKCGELGCFNLATRIIWARAYVPKALKPENAAFYCMPCYRRDPPREGEIARGINPGAELNPMTDIP